MLKNIFFIFIIGITTEGSLSMVHPIDLHTFNALDNISSVDQDTLVVLIPAGQVGSRSGISKSLQLPNGYSQLNLAYTLKLSGKFDCSVRNGEKITGKFPGISAGEKPNTGGLNRDQINIAGSSFRLTYRGYPGIGCMLEGYLYDNQMPDPKPGKKVYGKKIKTNVTIIPGKEYNVRLYVKINSSGKQNGEVKIYIGGQLVASRYNILFHNGNPNNGLFDTIRMSVFNGGGKGFELPEAFDITISDMRYW